MIPQHPPGALAWRPLPRWEQERPCPRCGGDVRARQWNELCADCRGAPEVAAAKLARRKRENRRYRAKGRTA